MMYTETSIDKVREADIIQVIGHFLDLKKAGALYECRSPFSQDKTASFKVTPSKNIFKCFSSGAGGDAIEFVILYEKCRFYEAIKKIAAICNITLEQEQVSEEVERKRSYKRDMIDVLTHASRKYSNELYNLSIDHWAREMIKSREINEDTITKFSIGYAPKNYQFLTNPLIQKGKLEIAKSAGLVNSKEGRSFDFFTDRLIFPIQDLNGNIVGFGGRCGETDSAKESGRKYINSKESDVYHKNKVLYGLYQAKRAISTTSTAVLVEGYTDVTSLHQNGCEIAVANCGTANLSDEQCLLLRRFASHIIICRDNDGLDSNGNEQKGILSAIKEVDLLLTKGFKVSVLILPEGEDPDSFSRKTKDIYSYILGNAEDAVIWKTNKINSKAANDPDALSEAVTEVPRMLYAIKDDVKRKAYVDTCRKLLKQPLRIITDKIESFKKEAEEKVKKLGFVENISIANDLGLPKGANFQQFVDNRFVIFGNACYFRGHEKFFKGTNFKIQPLFHIYGKQDNKRLCEVINELGVKKLIDFDTEDFVSKQKFEITLLKEGFFIWYENITNTHFTLLKNYILSDFIMAYELKTLGWQPKENFYAFANCMYHNGVLKNVNNYGIVQLETGIYNDSEYMEDVKHFYSPAFSEMYKYYRNDDDPYENDRYFIYKESPVSFNHWMQQLKKVYGKKAITGIAFIFATLIRDIYLKRYQFFPHLFLTGEKGSGKSKFGESLVALFTYKQEPFDLNSGTPVAFYRRLSRILNAPTMLEEYHDNVDEKIFQPIKGAYDGRGREIGKATGDNRTTTTKVNCSLILLSQYLSSRDDNSLTSRSIVEHFIKPTESFTSEQIENYAQLKGWEEIGMSSLIIDILQYRTLLEEKIYSTYSELNKSMKKELQGKEYQERMLQNYIALLVPLKILWEKFQFPFEYNEVFKQFKEAILDSSDLIIESEGLTGFWRVLEFLLDSRKIKTNYEFKIDSPIDIKLQTRKGETDRTWHNQERKQILYLRLGAIHQLYHKEVSTRDGVDVISENTLKNYFKSKKYFIGSIKSHRFADTSTSAYLFDYSMMHEGGILNLTRQNEDVFNDESNLILDKKETNLPF